jgi:COP9 signalosome complex subunit 6
MVQCRIQADYQSHRTSRTSISSSRSFAAESHPVCPQFTNYSSTPLLLLLQPASGPISTSVNAQILPFKAYEPTIEIRDRKSRSVFIEAAYNVETGEAERIAVDWTARGGGGGTSCEAD